MDTYDDLDEGYPLTADYIFRKGVELGCSDIHIKPGSPPKFRIRGEMVTMENVEPLTSDETRSLMYEVLDEEHQAAQAQNPYEYDFALDIPNVGRFRVNIYTTRSSMALVARLLQDKPKTLDELGIPPIVKDLALLSNGVVIVTGATGSGKSSTLAGIIDHINKNRASNIISIENPIEILHTDINSSISQREIGSDVGSFSSAVVASLRQDPDIIVVGEVRDLDTMKQVLLAADTGHLVITTLHTTDSVEAINRIVNMYPEAERGETRRILSSSLKGIIAQRLAPTVTGERIAVNEVLINDERISDMIVNPNLKSRDVKKVIQSSNDVGMITFEQTLKSLLEAGKISLETAKRTTDNATFFNNFEEKHSTPSRKSVGMPVERPRTGSQVNPPAAMPVAPHKPPQSLPAKKLPQVRKKPDPSQNFDLPRHRDF